ncbi:MAG: hypothetical protein FJ284_05410 [Planctomycetes bacterium]|nr:hypothetical protein [Planctomycetota bacterium]
MSTSAIIVLSLVSLLLLMALVAFGLGHKRWSWVSVAASFLVALTLAGYVYLVARLLDFEWKWVQVARATQLKIHEVRDALRPSTEPDRVGRLAPIDDGKSIADLRLERDRWERAVERIDNWRGRHWEKASFRPPTAETPTGTIDLPPRALRQGGGEAAEPAGDGLVPPIAGEVAPPADGDVAPPAEPGGVVAAKAGPPLDPGATVYVFDDAPSKDGGLYLGAFLVESAAADDPTGRMTLTVEPLAPPDEYDRAAWSRASDSVTVYDGLPTDRWLAFSKVTRLGSTTTPEDQVAPRPAKKSTDDLAELNVPEIYLAEVERHVIAARDASQDEIVPKEDWSTLKDAVASGECLPGEAWAEVVFKDQDGLDAFLGLERDSIEEDEDSLAAEVELGKAFELQDEEKATIRKVFRRRRLIDAATMVHGSVVPGGEAAGGDVMADGLAALMRLMRQEIAALEAANDRLAQGQKNVTSEQDIVRRQVDELGGDLVKWERDVAASTKLAEAFEAEKKRAASRLQAAEEAVVRLGRELDAAVSAAVRTIDQAAPPANRGAASQQTTF